MMVKGNNQISGRKTKNQDLYHLPIFVAFSATTANFKPRSDATVGRVGKKCTQLALTDWCDLVLAHHWLCVFRLQLPNVKQDTIPSHFLLLSQPGSLLGTGKTQRRGKGSCFQRAPSLYGENRDRQLVSMEISAMKRMSAGCSMSTKESPSILLGSLRRLP